MIFRDLINDHLYITTDAGNSFNYRDQLQFTPDVIQFSDTHEDYLFAIDNATNSVCFNCVDTVCIIVTGHEKIGLMCTQNLTTFLDFKLK